VPRDVPAQDPVGFEEVVGSETVVRFTPSWAAFARAELGPETRALIRRPRSAR